MKLKHVVFDRYIPIGGGKREFKSDGFDLRWMPEERCIRIKEPEGSAVFADTQGASWKLADEEIPTIGSDQPGPAAGPARGKKQKRQG